MKSVKHTGFVSFDHSLDLFVNISAAYIYVSGLFVKVLLVSRRRKTGSRLLVDFVDQCYFCCYMYMGDIIIYVKIHM